MTDPIQAAIAAAIRATAHDCPGDACTLTEQECAAEHPIEVFSWRHGQIASVYADVEAVAEVAAKAARETVDGLIRVSRHTVRRGLAGSAQFAAQALEQAGETVPEREA